MLKKKKADQNLLNFNILFCVKKGKFSELFSSCTQSYNFNAFSHPC